MKLKPVVASIVMLGLMAPVFAKGSLLSQQAVIDQNSVVQPVCSEGWFNRISVGGTGSVVGQIGNHDPAGAFTHLNSGSDLYINNFNLLVNAKLSSWSKAAVNLAYLGAPAIWNNTHVSADGKDAGDDAGDDAQWSYRKVKNSIVADEVYVTIGDLAKYPFYVIVGKKYIPFGDYTDPYTPYQIMSPAQMLSQTNAVTAIAGVSTNFGFYGSVAAFRGETYSVDSKTGNIKNFAAKIGYYDHLESFNIPNAHVNVAVSYMHNLWDSQVFSPNPNPQWTLSERAPVGGLSAHADLAYKAFSVSANLVTALKKMVDSTYSSKSESSKFWAADVNADYAFKTLDRDSHLGASVQWTGNGAWFGNNTQGITDWTRIIPKWRLLGEYKINLFKNTDLDLVVAHGKSYDFVPAQGSTSEPSGARKTTVGLARLMIQL